MSRFLLLVASLASFAACAGRNNTTNPPPTTAKPAPTPALEGVLQYRAFDATGVLVCRGTLTLIPSTASQVSGTWQISSIGDAGEIGPQTGSGTLEGTIEESGLISVNLNPSNADNNVYLNGTFDGRRFAGDWTFSTFVGTRATGTFEAVRSE